MAERKIPTVWLHGTGTGMDAYLDDPACRGGMIRLDTAAWDAWLACAKVRSFAYPIYLRERGYSVGFVTVRKERRRRGGTYWVAYRRVKRRLCNVSIGARVAVTRARLDAIANQLAESEVTPET